MNEPSDSVKARLLALCKAKDKTRRAAWILLALASLLLLIVVIAWTDHRFVLSSRLRMFGGISILLLIAFGVGGLVKILRRPSSLKEAALDFESHNPALGCAASTAAEYLSGERSSVKEYEPELVAALERHVAKFLKNAPFSYGKKLFWPSSFLTTALIVFLLFIFLTPDVSIALNRAVFPWTQAGYTKVEVKPGNLEIPLGRDLEIVSAFSGRPPKNPQFLWRENAGANWQIVSLTKSTNDTFVYPLKNIHAPLEYRVAGGDAISDTFKIKTYSAPEIRDLRVRLSFPEYTQRKTTEQTSPDITAVRGTDASVEIVSSVKLAKARLRFTNSPPIELASSGNNSWRGALKISTNADYWIELTDESGRKGENEKPFHIKALPDEPPRVEIISPGADIRAEATNRVPLKISVLDDFGVREIKVVFHTLGGPEHYLYCDGTKTETGEVIANAEIELAELWLEKYQLVAYHVEAKDNNTLDGPGVGKSAVYFIEITDEEGCISQCSGEKVNLLTIQKQIIADTAALAANSPSEKFNDLALRENDAVDFGKIYLEALGGAPDEVVSEMQSAIYDMEHAVDSLKKNARNSALPFEESALAHFYQVLKLMPELKNLPTKPPTLATPKNQSPKLKVVLDAIKKKQKERPSNQELARVLQEAKRLNQEQTRVNSACENPGAGNGKNAAEKLAEQQEQLSKEAKELAEKLKRLAEHDARLGRNVSLTLDDIAKKMESAANALKAGNLSRNENGLKSAASLSKVIAYLERLLRDEANLTDVANEEFPKEYETLIADYLKKLSYEE